MVIKKLVLLLFLVAFVLSEEGFSQPKNICEYEYEGTDEFTGQKRRDVSSKIFFTHTPENIRKYLNGKEYLTCWGNLTKISGGYKFLNLRFEVFENNAQKSFGHLPVNSLLSIRFLNGETIRLLNKRDFKPQFDSNKDIWIFKGQYSVDAKQEKKLAKCEIDKVRIVWETGYEDYEIYEIDFFKNQLDCLNKK